MSWWDDGVLKSGLEASSTLQQWDGECPVIAKVWDPSLMKSAAQELTEAEIIKFLLPP